MPTARLLSLVLLALLPGCTNTTSGPSWPIWGATPGRTFCVPDLGLAKPPSPGWSVELFPGGAVYDVVADARTVYVAGGSSLERGELAALRLADGKLLWRQRAIALTSGRAASFGPLMVLTGGKLYIAVEAGILVFRASNGSQLAAYDGLPCGKPGSLALSGGCLIVHGNAGKLTAIRPRDGKVAWTADLDQASGLVASDKVIAADGGFLNASCPAAFAPDGTRFWRHEAPIAKPSATEPEELEGGTCGILADGGQLVLTEFVPTEAAETMTGRLRAWDLRTGQPAWELPMQSVPGFGLAGDGKRLYVASALVGPGGDTLPGHLTCLDAATRDQVWSRTLGYQTGDFGDTSVAGFNSLPLLAGGVIIVRINVTDLVGLDAATGKTLWRQAIAKSWSGATPDHIILAGNRVIYTEAGRVATLIADGRGKTLLPLDVPPPATQPKR